MTKHHIIIGIYFQVLSEDVSIGIIRNIIKDLIGIYDMENKNY